jgi:hypothetical protein
MMANSQEALAALQALKRDVSDAISAIQEFRQNEAKYKTADRTTLMEKVTKLNLSVSADITGWDGTEAEPTPQP